MSRTARLCPLADLPPGEIRKAELPDGTAIALYNLDGRIYATADRCTHGDASLSDLGTIAGGQVECGFHFGSFDIATGEPCAAPCTEPLRVYPVTVVDGLVEVEF